MIVYLYIFWNGIKSSFRRPFVRDPFFSDFQFQTDNVLSAETRYLVVNDIQNVHRVSNKLPSESLSEIKNALLELKDCDFKYIGFVPTLSTKLQLHLDNGKSVSLAISEDGRSIGPSGPRSGFYNWYYKKDSSQPLLLFNHYQKWDQERIMQKAEIEKQTEQNVPE